MVIDVSTGAIDPIGNVYTNSAFNAIASPTREAPLCEGVVCEDDGNECTNDACNPETGTCDYPPVQDGTPCTDGFCLDGVCEVLCDVANVCQCSEFGIRAAINAGGNDPYTFDCDRPTTVMTNATIEINNDVILDGEGNLIVDGNATHRVFSVASGIAAELRGMTVARGAAQDGGGIANSGTLTLTNSTVSGNSSGYNGGGIENYGVLTLINSTVSGNNAGFLGGGIDNWDGVLTLTNSTVSGNSALEFGGGILSLGELTLSNSTVSRPSSGYTRGGIQNGFGLLTLTNSTVSKQCSIERSPAASTTTQGALALTYCALSENSAGASRGIYNYYGTSTVTNTLVDNDCAAEFGVPTTSAGYNMRELRLVLATRTVSTSLRIEPAWCPTSFRLDRSKTTAAPPKRTRCYRAASRLTLIPGAECEVETDQRGEPRPEPGGTMCDVGAFEVQP